MTTPQIAFQVQQIVTEGSDQVFNGLNQLKAMAVNYAPKILAAILIYLAGKWLINRTGILLDRYFSNRQYDPSLQSFLRSVVKMSLLVLLIITVISILGVNVTGFAALLAGAGLAIGSALNGSLGNFAGGVMILIHKPFRVGDMIQAQDHFGIVKEIGIVDTTILTSANQTIHLPNGALSTGVINNFTDQDNLRIDMKFPVADGTDIDRARALALEAMKAPPDVIDTPAPDVKVLEVDGDGIILVCRPRIKVKPYDPANPRQMEADYYSVFLGAREAIKKTFQANGIDTPSSTLEVTMMGNN